MRKPLHRDWQPGRPVRGLVGRLVGCLLDQEEIEQLWIVETGQCVGRRAIRREESLARAVTQTQDECPPRLVRQRGGSSSFWHQRGGSIIERPQQPGDIAQRACLGAALLERTRRFPFEVDDVDVAACDQYLAEMEI